MSTIYTRKALDPLDPGGGVRVLVERDWPEKMQNIIIHADIWLKDLAPSKTLADWFNHDPQKWTEFKTRYFAELSHQQEGISKLLAELKKGPLTLLNTSNDPDHDQSVALQEYLNQHS